MTFPWPSPPVDPTYTHFVAGVKAYWSQTEEPQRVRWHPRDAAWYSYGQPLNILEDVGLAPTAKLSGFSFGGMAPTFFDSELVTTYNSVSAAYARVASQYPDAVWDPVTGEWRLFVRSASAVTVPVKRPPLPQDVLDRIAKVRELVKDAIITPAEGDRRIDEIVTQWT